MRNLSTNTIKRVSDMELYTSVNFRRLFRPLESDSFNHEISVGEMVVGAVIPIDHIGRL